MARVLRPGSAPAVSTKPRGTFDAGQPAAPPVIRPASEGGEENLDGSALDDIATQYRDLEDQLEEMTKEVKDLEKKLAAREAILIEGMLAAKMQHIQIKGRTLYLLQDLIVNKGAGVSTEQLIETLRDVGFGDLASETVSAQSLKATVKEKRALAALAKQTAEGFDPTGESLYCPACMTFRPPAEEGTYNFRCMCQGEDKPTAMIETINGVPAALSRILFQQPKIKLGSRKV